jgi:arylsulfatase A-like enzyme
MKDKPGIYWENENVFKVIYHDLIFIIVMDSVTPKQFAMAETPNMDKGGFTDYSPAYAGATWTTPSVMHMMTGRLPFHNGKEQIFPHVYWLPQHFHQMEKGSTHYLSAACPPVHAIKYEWDTFYFPEAGNRWVENFVDKALDIIKNFPGYKKFFYMHFEETHSPYEWKGNPNPNWRIEEILQYNCNRLEIELEYFEYLKKRQRECITHIDKVLKPLLDLPSTMIITADHGECWGPPNHYFGHDCSALFSLLEVPLLVRI